MPSAFPDTATLHSVLDDAGRAPSAQNAQPWRWRVDSAGLHLDADWSRRLGDTLADRCDVLLGCGAVLHHCAVALAAAGWQARIRRFPYRGSADHLASFELIEAAPADGALELARAIPRRRADRRDYGRSPLPAGTLELLHIRAARLGVHMSVVPRVRWVRSDDGGVRLAYRGGARQGGRPGAGDGALLVLATDADDDHMRCRAGEAMSHVLLSATAMGLASCPITEPLRHAGDRLALACEIFDGDAYPQALIRLGPAPVGAGDLPAVERRSVAQTTAFVV